MSKSWNQGSHTFSKTIFHTFSIPNEKTLLPSLIFIFFNFIHGAQCKIYLRNCHRRKMQNSNKRIAKFEISILFHYCMCILAKFSTFSRSWKPILKINAFSYFQNRVGTLYEINEIFLEAQDTYRGFTRGARGYKFLGAESLRGAESLQRAKKIQQFNKYFLQYSTFVSERPRVRTWERQTCFLPGRYLISLRPCTWVKKSYSVSLNRTVHLLL